MKTSIYQKLFAAFLFCLLLLPLTTLTVAAAPYTKASTSPDFAKIDAYVNAQMQDARIPGLALGITHDDQVAHLHGFGAADSTGRAVTAQTPFFIGSTTKSFTALAIMQLVESGKITLDAPVQRYLPWFRVADPVASRHITIRHLLNQVSGIPTPAGLQPFIDVATKTPEQYVHELSTVALTKPIGTAFQYSNANYAILGLIVQVVSGESYKDYLQQHILNPLQMQHSFVSQAQAQKAGLAQGHQSLFGFPVPSDLPIRDSLFSAGYLMSSAQDMSHYLIAQGNGGRYNGVSILSPQGIDTLHRPASVMIPGFTYAMGWVNFTQNGETIFWHNGDTLNFHADMLVAPAHHWGIVVLVNEGDAIVNSFSFSTNRIAIGQHILQMLEGQQPAPTGWSVNSYYLVLDSILTILFVLIVIDALRLSHWYRRFAQRSRRHLVRVSFRLIGEIVVPILILLGFPMFLGDSWPMILLGMPDIGWWFLISMSLLLITGIVRTILVVRVLSRKNIPLTKEAPSPSLSLR